MLDAIGLVPKPLLLELGAGQFNLRSSTLVVALDEEALIEASKFAEKLRVPTGFPLLVAKSETCDSVIRFGIDATLIDALGQEGYHLEVRNTIVDIKAAGPAGLFYAGITLFQLFPLAIYSKVIQLGQSWQLPCCKIEDKPRFEWRGMHLDVARHFMPLEFVLRFIDGLSHHKMNRFHWHLTDDQGWRIEVLKFPNLTKVGAWRKETRYGYEKDEKGFDGIPHGGFYTRDDARCVVKYASDRHIIVIPEIEMPGHCQALIASYPELGNFPERKIEVWTKFGVSEVVVNMEPSTLEFFKSVLREVVDIFPSKYVHIGGDECPRDEWKESAKAQQRVADLGLTSVDDLQGWFIHQIAAFLNEMNRSAIGWDEILDGPLAPNAIVMSWRGVKGGIRAAKLDHYAIMAPTSHTYFDFRQSDGPNEPLSQPHMCNLEKVYSYDPVPSELSAEESKYILGGQGQLWSEYMKTPGSVEYMAFPRLCALSEVLWSTSTNRSYPDFLSRLKHHFLRLNTLKVNARKLDTD